MQIHSQESKFVSQKHTKYFILQKMQKVHQNQNIKTLKCRCRYIYMTNYLKEKSFRFRPIKQVVKVRCALASKWNHRQMLLSGLRMANFNGMKMQREKINQRKNLPSSLCLSRPSCWAKTLVFSLTTTNPSWHLFLSQNDVRRGSSWPGASAKRPAAPAVAKGEAEVKGPRSWEWSISLLVGHKSDS